MPPRFAGFLSALCCVVFGSLIFQQLTQARNENIATARASQPTPRIVRAVPASGPLGGLVSVPIELASQGDENAIGFSLTFDAATLGNPMAGLGSGAAGATLNINTAQAAQGRLGVALAFPANQKFSAGARQMIVVTFSIPANAAFGTTTINFGDQPVMSEASDVNANALPLSFSSGAVMITKGFEADVTPRPDGDNNGMVTTTDWVQIGRFVAGVDAAGLGNEFQRADCAPRASLGNGRISITDWTQAGRYAAGLDPVSPAGGPTAPVSQISDDNGRRKMDSGRSTLVYGASQAIRGGERLTIAVNALGSENALGFSLRFDAKQWRFASAAAGHDARTATLQINADQAARGRIGVALALPAGRALQTGSRQLLVLEFATLIESQPIPLVVSFGDAPIPREIADAGAQPVLANYTMESTIAGVAGERQLRMARRK